mgnify:FL=1
MTKAKIVRRPDFAGGGITDAERAAMAEHVKLWTARATRTDPIVPDRIGSAIRDLYAAAGLKAPRVVIVPSPIVMAFAGGFAAGIWWLRKNGRATDDATLDATLDATDAATLAATYDATYAATRAATLDATRAATLDATDAATRADGWAYELALHFAGNVSDARYLLECAARWWNTYQGGNMWAPWDCYLTAARDILGLRLDQHEKYAAWERCAIEGGFRVMHDEFCMVSDFPERLLVDPENRPHCDDGPSHRWRDGWSLWHIHGVRVTEQIVLRPDTLTLTQIRDERNAEVRRVMIERFGESRYIEASGMKPIANDEVFGTLYESPLKDQWPNARIIRVVNRSPEPDGTFKPYWLDVNGAHYGGDAGRIPQAAVASTWRLQSGALAFRDYRDYRPQVET